MKIVPISPLLFDAWVTMRRDLWPEQPEAALRAGAGAMLADNTGKYFVLIASDGSKPIGFAEIALRTDHVNGCETSPVGFLEGIYVEPGHRKRGAARALVAAAEEWSRARGCAEFASDALIENEDSRQMHKALGFKETERVVYFRKPL
jgi:aminoglycoside 6'-N-acetyltransferase I